MDLTILKNFLNQNSKSSDIEDVNKFGDLLKSSYKDLNLVWSEKQLGSAPKFLIGKSKHIKGLPNIVLSGHIDTVLTSSDIAVKKEENKLYGSGSSDMKGSVFAMMESLKLLHKKDKLLNITVALSPEEELADPTYREVIGELSKEADYCLVFESTLNTIEQDEMTRSVVIVRRGIHIWKMKIMGPAGHSGVIKEKDKRHNAILKMAEVVLKLESLADYKKGTTINTGVITGGKVFNILAPECEIDFECRFFTEEEHTRIENAIRNLVKDINKENIFSANLDEGLNFPSMEESEDNKGFIGICKKVGEELRMKIVEERRGGGSEQCLFKLYNKKIKILDGFGIKGEGEHTYNEFLYISSIKPTINFVVKVIRKLQSNS